jgi:hypothetical protein
MFSILFIAACWILIQWLATSTTIPLPLLLPVLVVAADYLQP